MTIITVVSGEVRIFSFFDQSKECLFISLCICAWWRCHILIIASFITVGVLLVISTSVIQNDRAILEGSSVHTWVLLMHLQFGTVCLLIVVDGCAHRVVVWVVRFAFGSHGHWLVVTVFVTCCMADLLRGGARSALNLDVRRLVLYFELQLLLVLLVPYGGGRSQVDTTGGFWSPLVSVDHLAALIVLVMLLINSRNGWHVLAPTLKASWVLLPMSSSHLQAATRVHIDFLMIASLPSKHVLMLLKHILLLHHHACLIRISKSTLSALP